MWATVARFPIFTDFIFTVIFMFYTFLSSYENTRIVSQNLGNGGIPLPQVQVHAYFQSFRFPSFQFPYLNYPLTAVSEAAAEHHSHADVNARWQYTLSHHGRHCIILQTTSDRRRQITLHKNRFACPSQQQQQTRANP